MMELPRRHATPQGLKGGRFAPNADYHAGAARVDLTRPISGCQCAPSHCQCKLRFRGVGVRVTSMAQWADASGRHPLSASAA